MTGRAGFVGPLPGRAGILDAGLDAGILTRWDRWWELCSGGGEALRLHPYRPAWRLIARAGLFAPEAVAGAFRLGRDQGGRVYPFAVLRAGPLPDPADPWFDTAESLATQATEGALDPEEVRERLLALPVPRSAEPLLDGAAVLWRDDRLLRELAFASAAGLAAFPLDLAAMADPEEESEAA